MKLIFTSPNFAEVGLIRGLLESENIECFARNERVSMAMGEVPFLDCQPQIWIVKDEDRARAEAVLARYRGGAADSGQTRFEAWICPQCGETNEGQFGACWKCEFLIDGL